MFEPSNEMGVIVTFAQACVSRGWEIVSIQTPFPDATIRNRATLQTYRAEFEYMANSFIEHGHDPRGCDLIICWSNNLPEWAQRMPVWELSDWRNDEINPVPEIEMENLSLRMENARLKLEIKKLKADTSKKIKEIKENLTDWRNLPEEDKRVIAGLTTQEIVDRYKVSERTAWNWRTAAQRGSYREFVELLKNDKQQFTNQQLADRFCVSVRTISTWRAKYMEEN